MTDPSDSKKAFNTPVFCLRIKEVREVHGLTQKDFADRLGTYRQHVRKVEANEAVVSADLMLQIQREFGVSLEYLYGTTEIMDAHGSATEQQTAQAVRDIMRIKEQLRSAMANANQAYNNLTTTKDRQAS